MAWFENSDNKRSLGARIEAWILQTCRSGVLVGLALVGYFHFIADVPDRSVLTTVEFEVLEVRKHYVRRRRDYYRIDAQTESGQRSLYLESRGLPNRKLAPLPKKPMTALVDPMNNYIYELKSGDRAILSYEQAKQRIQEGNRTLVSIGLSFFALGASGLLLSYLINVAGGLRPRGMRC